MNLPPLTVRVTTEDAAGADSQLEGLAIGSGECPALTADRDEAIGGLDDGVIPEFDLDAVRSGEQFLVHRPDSGPAAADPAERIIHRRNITRFPISGGEVEV